MKKTTDIMNQFLDICANFTGTECYTREGQGEEVNRMLDRSPGLTIQVGKDCMVFVDNEQPEPIQHFIKGHELAHFFLGDTTLGLNDACKARHETAADVFSAVLLALAIKEEYDQQRRATK